MEFDTRSSGDDRDLLPLTLDHTIQRLRGWRIEEAYQWFGYDYVRSASIDEGRKDAARDRFIALLAWKVRPTTELTRRFFNQVNTFYAERLIEDTDREPMEILQRLNETTLFNQGKHVGFRVRRIEFGYRSHLDVLDPRRHFKWLSGVSPDFVRALVEEWCRVVTVCPRHRDTALALAMALIAIHPFADANGRIGRLAFTHLCKRWALKPEWLNEADDGELLRTGYGIASTEYLMAMLMIKMTQALNTVDLGAIGRVSLREERRLAVTLRRQLTQIGTSGIGSSWRAEFELLKQHLLTYGHLCSESPRFRCLRDSII